MKYEFKKSKKQTTKKENKMLFESNHKMLRLALFYKWGV